jgi:hypothetical protein
VDNAAKYGNYLSSHIFPVTVKFRESLIENNILFMPVTFRHLFCSNFYKYTVSLFLMKGVVKEPLSLFVVIVALLMILGSLSSIPLGGAGNHSGNSGKSSPFQPFYNQFSPAITGTITINIIPGNSEIQINGELIVSNISEYNYTGAPYGLYNIVAYKPFYEYNFSTVNLLSPHAYVNFTLHKGTGINGSYYPWVPIGPYNELVNQQNGSAPRTAGHLGTMVIYYKNPQIMYVGTGSSASPTYGPYGDSGIYKTTNGGKTWVPTDFGLPLDVVSSIIMNQSNPNELLVGFWNAGIYKTIDGGGYWFKVANFTYITDMTCENGTIFSGTGENIFGGYGSVVKSTNFGSSWSVLLNTTSPVSAISVSQNYIYALECMGNLYKSTNLGLSWTLASLLPKGRGYVQSITSSPSNPNDVYAILADNNTTYYSTDGGVNFSPIPSLNGLRVVAYDSQNSSIVWLMSPYFTDVSTDGGINFTKYSPVGDQHNIYLNPLNASTSYILTDQGIYQTNNFGKSWFSDNGNLYNFLVYDFGIGNNGKWIITSMQDFGGMLTHDGGSTWSYGSLASQYGLSEGSIVYMNQANSSWIYAFDISNKRLVESSNGGLSFNVSIDMSSINFNGYPPVFNQLFSIDPQNHSILYFGGPLGIYNGTKFGENWTLWKGSPAFISSLWVAPDGTFFVSNGTGLYFFAGGKWTKSAGVSFPVASIAGDPLNASTILITTGTSRTNASIFESTNYGRNFFLMENNPFNFPFTPPTQQGYGGAPIELFFLNISGNPLLATTNEGIFISMDLGRHWSSINYNLLSGQVTWAAYINSSLYISTYGEGIQVWHNFSIENLSATVSGNLSGYNGFNVKIDGVTVPIYDGHYSKYIPPGQYNISISWVGGSKNYTATLSPMQTFYANISRNYSVTFTESGLPTGTPWFVNLSNGNKSGAITGTSYSFSLTNGSYSYTIATIDKSYESPSGSYIVNGNSVSKSVSFSEVRYTVTFTESGLPQGTAWYVNLSNGFKSKAIFGSSYTFQLSNGTYSYTIDNISGYSASAPTGSLSVNGSGVSKTLTFSAIKNSPQSPRISNSELYAVVGGLIAVSFIGAVLVPMRKRR